jgi:transcriptional regulator with XRE-family HTH domain
VVTGNNLRLARTRLGWTQADVAARLGVSQPYVALWESNRRPLPKTLARRAVRVLRMAPTVLPVTLDFEREVDPDWFVQQLSALGYPGFAYVRPGRKRNPAELLLTGLSQKNLEARLVESLPWLLLHYPAMDRDWLVDQARRHNLQNRLGFVVSLALQVANANDEFTPELRHGLSSLQENLRRSRLADEDTLCQANLLPAERVWLRENRTVDAAYWNLLSDWKPEQLQYAAMKPL